MSIKLIATDLDGTLLQDDHISIGEENLQALRQASEQGIYIVLASGRTQGLLSETLRQAGGLVTHTLISNGAVIIDLKTEGAIMERLIPYEVWLKIYGIIRRHGGVCEIYCERSSYMECSELENYTSALLPREFIAELKSHIIPVQNLPDALRGKPIEKINVISTPEDRFDAMQSSLDSLGVISLTSSLPGNLEINARGVNKGEALRLLCESLGIAPDQVLACGDAGNDLEMLSWAGRSFAVANGTEAAKRAARAVTPANWNGGVAKAIRRCLSESI